MNRLKHPKAQSAGTATTSKTQPTLTDNTNTAIPHEDEVKVENISPDTSPAHQSTTKPSNTLVHDGNNSSSVENSRSVRRVDQIRKRIGLLKGHLRKRLK